MPSLRTDNRIKRLAVASAITSAILFFSAWVLEEKGQQKSTLKEVALIAEENLKALENSALAFADSALSITDKSQLLNFVSSSALSSHGITVLVYVDAELAAWSGSDVTFLSIEKLLADSSRLVHLPNGWHELLVREKDNRTAVIFISVFNDYAYQNKYLVNEFNPALGIPSAFSLADNNVSELVRGHEGNILFGISALTPSVSSEEKFPLAEVLDMLAILAMIFCCTCIGRILLYRSVFAAAGFALLILALRAVMVYYRFPEPLYNTSLFSPEHYASSFFFGSLGDLVLNIFLSLSVALIFFRHEKIIAAHSVLKPSQRRSVLTHLLWIMLIVFTSVAVHYFVSGLIINSKISFALNNIFELNEFSALGFISIAMMMAFYLLILRIATDAISRSFLSLDIKTRYVIFTLVIALVILLHDSFSQFTVTATYSDYDFFTLILLCVLSEVFFIRRKASFFQFTITLLLIFSGYTCKLLSDYSRSRDIDNLKAIAKKIEAEQDLVAEHLFSEIQNRLSNDSAIERMAAAGRADLISQRLQQVYLSGYWSRYDSRIFCYDYLGAPMLFSSDSVRLNFFQQLITEHGKAALSENLFFIGGSGEKYSYIAKLFLRGEKQNNTPFTLIVLLSEKFLQTESGFPELFLSGSVPVGRGFGDYSFARYHKSNLISGSGRFPYPLSSTAYEKTRPGFSVLQEADSEHLIYRPSEQSLVVITWIKFTLLDLLTLFSYITAFFSLLLIIVFLVVNLSLKKSGKYYSLKQRIRFSVMAVVVVSFILTGWGTIRYITAKYDAQQDDGISSKITEVLRAMENELEGENILANILSDEKTSLLLRLSSNLSADFNLFDLNGRLIFSSQPKLYQQGIISDRMNPLAFQEMSQLGKTKFVHSESIGKLKYIAAYQPVRNRSNITEGYIALPYFEKHAALKKEISSFIGSLMNLYILLLALALSAAYFISSRITIPLQELQEKFSSIRLGRHSEKIEWKRKDEIGALVGEYNRMVEELAVSADMLARSERESAWREMAKQVAHEIKNPLTPMKLSIQHLQRAIREGSPEVNSLTEKISATLIEQIDALSSIATAFSSFAKMPQGERKPVSVNEILLSVIALYRETAQVEIVFVPSEKNNAFVLADREELTRLFSNIVKNAIQAIPDNQQGKVEVTVLKEINRCIISVSDNGTGIADEIKPKIFSPNFTTKTTGMGLGLAMVRNIAESVGGSIWFETSSETGTMFYVELPLSSRSS
jgi:two-component system, NtrC family, nitrogen regulation sensor histidine kinase NtrY